MRWLDERLYTTEYEQSQWSVEIWRDVWAQIMKTVTEALDVVTTEMVEQADGKEQRLLIMRLKNKEFAHKELSSWDLSKMSYKIKLLIKAQILQRDKYEIALSTYNFKELDNVTAPAEPFDIRCGEGTEKNLKAYYDLGVYV